MKKRNILIAIISIAACTIASLFQQTTITVASKEYKTGSSSGGVSTRDLSMLA